MSSRDFNWASWGGVRSCDAALHHHYWSYAHHVINYIIVTHIMWSSTTSLLLLQQLAFISHDSHVTLINCYLQNTVDVWEPVSTCLVNPRSCSRACSVGEREKISAMGVARLMCLPFSLHCFVVWTNRAQWVLYSRIVFVKHEKKKKEFGNSPTFSVLVAVLCKCNYWWCHNIGKLNYVVQRGRQMEGFLIWQ